MPSYYAWEAAEAVRPSVVHAVKVLNTEGRISRELTALEGRTGDRDTQTFCGRKVGQSADLRLFRSRGARGLLGYRRRLVRNRVIPYLRLRRRAELASLPRCRNCERSIHASWRVVQQVWRDLIGGGDFRLVEWTEDLPPYPETPVIVQQPAPAPFPTYYRYHVSSATMTANLYLPDLASWLPTGSTLLAGAGNSFLTTGVFQWDQARWGYDWHNPRVPTLPPVAGARVPYDVQVMTQERRTRQQVAWMREVHEALDRGLDHPEAHVQTIWTDMNAMELVRDVCGPEAVVSLAANGWVDVPSAFDSTVGYRIRPWRRVGRLSRNEDGSWRERPSSWCIHPDDTFPIGDEVATLWLLLRFNEQEFLRIANVHDRRAVPLDARREPTYLNLLAEQVAG